MNDCYNLYEIYYLYDDILHKYIDKKNKLESEFKLVYNNYDNLVSSFDLLNQNNLEILCFVKFSHIGNVQNIIPFICKNGKFVKIHNDYYLQKSFSYIIKNYMIIYESKNNEVIPENINALIIITPIYKNGYNDFLLPNLPNSIEYIYYFGSKHLIENANNLPISLKKLYIRNDVNVDNIKLPFGCSIEKFENL